MKKIKLILSALALSIAIIGCSQEEEKEPVIQKEFTTETQPSLLNQRQLDSEKTYPLTSIKIGEHEVQVMPLMSEKLTEENNFAVISSNSFKAHNDGISLYLGLSGDHKAYDSLFTENSIVFTDRNQVKKEYVLTEIKGPIEFTGKNVNFQNDIISNKAEDGIYIHSSIDGKSNDFYIWIYKLKK